MVTAFSLVPPELPPLYFGMDGTPISVLEWGALLEDFPRRIIGEDMVKGVGVLTVWIGIRDDIFSSVPMIFGSAIVCTPYPDLLLGQIGVYPTKELAAEAHGRIVDYLRANDPKAEGNFRALRDLVDEYGKAFE